MSAIYSVILFFACITIFYLFFVGPWLDYRTDLLRQKLFKIRDDLFWYVDRYNGIDFSTDAYCISRTTLNGMIRFADELTFGRIVIEYCVFRSSGVRSGDYERELDEALRRIDQPHQDRIRFSLHKMHEAVMAHMIATSLPLCLFFLPSKIVSYTFPRIRWSIVSLGLRIFSRQVPTIDLLANTMGTDRVVSTEPRRPRDIDVAGGQC